MKWNSEKVSILKDRYPFADLDELANQLGTTTKAVIRKAQKLKLYRAKNNQIFNNYKFCSFCKKEHHISEFYRNRSKFDGYEYYCKKYYLQKDTTTPLSKRASTTETRANTTDKRVLVTVEYSDKRPRNPTIFRNGIEGKICNRCHTFKPLDLYSRDKGGIRGRKAICKQCYKEKTAYKKVE